MEDAWSMHGICMECLMNMNEVLVEDVWTMEYAWDMHWNMSAQYIEFAWN